MPTYNLVAYQLPFGWLDSNGSNFTYSTGSMPSDVLTVTETDGTADDWFDDYSPSSHPGDSATQVAQADVFGFSIDGKVVQAAAWMRLTGSDGSDFQVYLVITGNGVAGLDDDDKIFVSEQPFLDGVIYTKVAVGGFNFGINSDGEVEYADLVQVPPPDGYVDGTAGNDLINTSYVGDPDGDMVDNNDAVLPGHSGDDDYIRAGDGDDVVLAGAGNDMVEGGAGADVISGGTGNDTIDGGTGDDLIEGGAGADAIDGGTGTDTATYANSASAVDVNLLDGTGSGGEAAGDTLTNVENLVGSDYDDTLQGDFGDNDIDGGTGSDTIIGGAGDDTITGGNDNDTIYGDYDVNAPTPVQTDYIVDGYFKGTNFHLTNGHFANSGSTVFVMDTEPTRVRFVDSDSDMDTDPTNEQLDPAESGLVELDGVLYSYIADFTITYDGSDGNTYEFVVVDVDLNGSGDFVAQTVGSDDYFEDGQILLPVTPAPPEGITLTSPGIGIGVQIAPNSLDYTTLAGYTPATYNDTIDGGDGDDTIYGGLGNDIITGGTGADTVSGGVGTDSIDGGAGNDILDGNDGDDVVSGGAGNDSVSGGLDNDILTGGAGDDVFTYADGDGMDIITDFGTGESGPTDDGDQTNNDFVDLAAFYNASTVAAVNGSDGDPDNDFANAIGMMRADQADGVLDGIIGGVDYTSQIGNIDLTIQNGGSAVDGDTLTHDNTNVVCFVRGTRIATQNGEIAIENLAIGDKIMTVDRGYQPIRWIGSTTVPATGKRAPIVFAKGAIGNAAELRVSPNHRVLLTGWQAGMLFGETEVLVAAKHLVNDTSIQRNVGGTVEYFHMLFDRHEIIFSEGARTESFHPGQQGWGALAEQTRAEILELLPQLDPENFATYGQSARLSLKAAEGELARDIGGFIQDLAPLERQS